MTRMWQAVVVVEFPVADEDERERYPGDAPIDFARRAVVERLHPALEAMRASISDSHWMIRATNKDGALAEVRDG